MRLAKKMKNRIINLNRISSTCLLGLLSACSSATIAEAKPAVLIDSSSTTHQIIEQVISQALNGKKVTIAKDSFLQSNQLLIEKKHYSSIEAPAIDGLILGGPKTHRFALFSKGTQCYLVYAKTGKKYPLNEVKCKTI